MRDEDRIVEGGDPDCPHENTVETVDDSGELVEPPSDTCIDCGAVIY